MQSLSPIQSFFRGRHVLVTGGSGFLGQALLEKLLRCCPDVGSVQLLLRPQRGLDASQRLHQLLRSPSFKTLWEQKPELLSKVKAVNGDVSKKELGISMDDRQHLHENISVVFHSAATIYFNEPIRKSVDLNCLGTKRVLELCKSMPKIQAFVHVSTAFTNADKPGQEIAEELYPPPADPEIVMEACGSPFISDSDLQELFGATLRRFPNTYTFSKALAEDVVARAAIAPTAIVRPSIVTASYREPCPGWIDKPIGVFDYLRRIAQGTLRSNISSKDIIFDIVPVDFVANSLIAVAWKIAEERSRSVAVYHCTSSARNPIRKGDFTDLAVKYSREYPTNEVVWYPSMKLRTNHFLHNMFRSLLTPRALASDVFRRLQGKPFKIRKILKSQDTFIETTRYFVTHDWTFRSDKIHHIISHPQDKANFYVDVSDLDWKAYMKICMIGMRDFIFKDKENSHTAAEQKIQKLLWTQRCVKVSTVLIGLCFASSLTLSVY